MFLAVFLLISLQQKYQYQKQVVLLPSQAFSQNPNQKITQFGPGADPEFSRRGGEFSKFFENFVNFFVGSLNWFSKRFQSA